MNNPALQTIIIEPTKGWKLPKLRELWDYRELLYFLVWRDLAIRYKQTIVGSLWAIVTPFTSMIIFSLFFGLLVKVPSDGIPYPIFSYAALVPWTLFADALARTSSSMVGNSNLITKAYFPRLIVPMAGTVSGVFDFLIAFVVLLVMMLLYGYLPTINILLLPFFLLLALLTTLGVGLWFAALNVRFRDIYFILPYITQAWLFATPVTYSSSLLQEPWRTLYGINPMASVIDGFRWALLGINPPPPAMIAVSTVVAVVAFISGLLYFKRVERIFADLV